MIELTESMATWLTENYGKVPMKECTKRFQVSETTVRKWVRMLGMNPSLKAALKEKVKPVEVEIKERHFCADCIFYQSGGYCRKNRRHTGALNDKGCFKQNNHEEDTDN